MEDKVSNFREVTVSISMSKSVYLEVTDGMSKEQFIEKAKLDILTPDKALPLLASLLINGGIKVSHRDIADWNVDELEYIVDDFDTPNGTDTIDSTGEQSNA